MKSNSNTIVLCIHPFARGVAFVFFDAKTPILWGVKDIRGANRNPHVFREVKRIMAQCQSGVLVLPDAEPRAPRIRKLCRLIADHAEKQGIRVRTVTRAEVCAAFVADLPGAGASGRAFVRPNRYQIAQAIAARFEVFAQYLPKPRRLWESEDARMSLFDAVAGAVALGTDEDERQ